MSSPAKASHEPVTSTDMLVAYMASGMKPASQWRIGTEHEKFAFTIPGHRPAPYGGENGIRALLEGMRQFGWEPVVEAGNIIGLVKGDANVSLEPGGQFELSGAPLDHVHQTCDEVHTHLHQVKTVAAPLGIGMIGLGFHPEATRADIDWMPKGRYKIMGAYMPKRGAMGIDMMTRTCTVQVNLDFASEADMVTKFRIGLALQPIAVALFANSPFTEGRPNGYLSYRSLVWTDTDPDRTGTLPFVFEDGMGFERYVDYALDVPMYFVYRNGTYIDASGQSFRDFLAGKLPALPGELPTLTDWADHLTTLFPEVRLKKYLEMRGADGGPWNRLCALPALWVGLLYDGDVQGAAWDLVKDWTAEDHARLRAAVPKQGLAARVAGRTVREIAAEMLDLSTRGLDRRGFLDRKGTLETSFLAPLRDTVERGKTPAEDLLDAYHGRWQGSLEPLYREHAY